MLSSPNALTPNQPPTIGSGPAPGRHGNQRPRPKWYARAGVKWGGSLTAVLAALRLVLAYLPGSSTSATRAQNYTVTNGIEGVKIKFPNNGLVQAGLISLAGPNGEVLKAYCVDVTSWLGTTYEVSVDGSQVMNQYGPQVRTILERSYPNLTPSQVASLYGVELPSAEPERLAALTATATQVAIWNFAHGFRYGGVDDSLPADQAEYVSALSSLLIDDALNNPTTPPVDARVLRSAEPQSRCA